MTNFWKNWFTLWCAFIILFGAILAGAGLEPTDGPATMVYAMVGAAATDWTPHLRFATALMGAVTMGWGITLLFAVRAASAMGVQGAGLWRGMAIAIIVWFVVDSILSVATGFWMNVVSNAVLTAGFLIGIVGSGALSARQGE